MRLLAELASFGLSDLWGVVQPSLFKLRRDRQKESRNPYTLRFFVSFFSSPELKILDFRKGLYLF